MIDYRFVQKRREEIEISEETIEKDYLIELLLNYTANDKFLKKQLIFRGGTALKKIYFSDFRYSEDIDFIIDSGRNINKCVGQFSKVITRINRDFPVELRQESKFPQRGHLQLFIYYEIVPEIRSDKKLKIDIIQDSTILQSSSRQIVFSCNDFVKLKRNIKTYHLESIAAEKIGRILDVVDEPRDLWDLLFLLKLKSNLKVRKVKNNFKEKYNINIYLPNLISAIRKPEYKKNWEIRLKSQVPDLTPYENAIEELETLIKKKF